MFKANHSGDSLLWFGNVVISEKTGRSSETHAFKNVIKSMNYLKNLQSS
jgi:hypothetical protein